MNEKNEFDHEFIPHKMDINSNQNEQLIDSDVKCGIGSFSPKWLQIFASKKAFVVVYALTGMQISILGSYYIGTMSTVEKNFNMSSKMSGMIAAAWEIGSLVSNIAITYIAAKGHRTRWVAMGILLMSISSFMKILPHAIFGAGENIKLYTKEYQNLLNDTEFLQVTTGNTTRIKKLSTNVNCDKINSSHSDMASFYIFSAAQIILGLGTAVYWSCGSAYLDDNARKNIVPVLLAIVQAVRLLGPTIGFLLSSYCLKIYVDPNLMPIISDDDPRWVGAWWMGWYPIGILGAICAFLMALFPKMLPRTALRRANRPLPPSKPISFADFKSSMKRILKNKIIVFNTLSSVSFIVGQMASWTFMPKYMESQFRLSASQSSFLTAVIGILSNALGILVTGLVITKVKPAPRSLAGWNVFVEFLDTIGRIGYAFLSCPVQTYHGHWNADHSWNLTETCNAKFNCGNDIQYGPVCDLPRDIAFYSSCHAGCTSTSMINNTLAYHGCSCVPGNGTVVDGLCPVDCTANMWTFFSMMMVLSFTSATGRSCNTLIQFRCADEEDKSLSISVTETFMALLGFMPAPILYGIIMDWTCMVWGDNCGLQGNCWIYDSAKLRIAFNLTATGFLFLGTILDCFVWYHVKDLKIYDEDFLNDKPAKKTADQVSTGNFSVKDRANEETDLPLIGNTKEPLVIKNT